MTSNHTSHWPLYYGMFALMIGFVQLVEGGEVRTWTERKGSRTVVAEFVESDHQTVTIRRRSDGQEFTVLLINLSDADQQYVKSLRKLRTPEQIRADEDKAKAELRAVAASYSSRRFDDGEYHPYEVTIRLSKVTDVQLAALSKLHYLESVNLSYKSGIDGSCLEYLRDLEHLRRVHLHECGVTDESLAALSGHDLEVLILSETKVTDAGVQHLQNFKNLQELSLAETGVTDTGVMQLKQCIQLEKLDLSATPVTDDGLAVLARYVNLETLRLRDAKGINGSGLQHAAKLTKLQTIDLSGAAVTDQGLEAVDWPPMLSELILTTTTISGTGLSSIRGHTMLKRLNCQRSMIADDGLVAIKRLPSLATLWLDSTRVTDAGIEGLESLPELRELSLSKTAVTGASFASLKNFPKLQKCYLYGAAVSDNGLEAIADSKILELNLGSTKISDAGVAKLRGATKLRSLWLMNTDVTDQAVEHLAKIANLEDVRIRGSKVSAAGVDKLKASRPDLKVSN